MRKGAAVVMATVVSFVAVVRGEALCLCDEDPDDCGQACHECEASIPEGLGESENCQHLDLSVDLAPVDDWVTPASDGGGAPGEELFTVDSPELKAKSKEIEVLARRLKVYHELKRSSADLEAQLSLRQAEPESMLAGAEATDGVVVIRATADGVVDGLPVADGAWIASGTAVVELIRPERKRAKALVVSSEAARFMPISMPVLRRVRERACGSTA